MYVWETMIWQSPDIYTTPEYFYHGSKHYEAWSDCS